MDEISKLDNEVSTEFGVIVIKGYDLMMMMMMLT
jgi:hypothetical protein